MNSTALPPAEATDRHGRLLLYVVLLAATLMFSNAGEHVLAAHTAQWLKYTQLAMVALMLALLAPALRWKLRVLPQLNPSEKAEYFARDSFMVHAYLRARNISWAATLFTLFALAPISRSVGHLPPDFFLHLALGVSFGVFGLVALVLSR